MSWSIFLLDIILLLQLKCTKQSILDHYSVNKSQVSHDINYTPSASEDGKYHSEDYAAMDSVKSIPGKPGLDYPVLDKVPETSFSCEARPEGYYADPETGCQVFHICLTQSVKNSFLCPNGSIFSQKLFTCDWWNRVDCQFSENVNQNKNSGQKFIRYKVLSTPEKLNNIVEDIQIGKGKNQSNMDISEVNDSKQNTLISTLRPQIVTQPTTNTKFPVTKPVVSTQQTKSNTVESVTSYLVLPSQYKCCNYSKDSKLSEPLQIQLLNLDQVKSKTTSLSQDGQFSQAIQDSLTLTSTDSLQQNSEPNVMLSQQKNDKDDSLFFPTFGLLRSNQRNFMMPNLQFKNNLQSPVSTVPTYTSIRPQIVTQPTTNTKFPVTKPVVSTQQTKSNTVESVTSYLVLPSQYKCCNYSKDSKLSEPLQIQLLNLDQVKSKTTSLSQDGQFSQAIQDSLTLTSTDSLQQNSEPNVMLSQQKNDKDDSLFFPTFGLLRSNQRNFMMPNLQFKNNLQSPVSTLPTYTSISKTLQKASDTLNLNQGSPQLSKPFVMTEQTADLFYGSYNPSTKFLHRTTLKTFELPQHTTPSMLEQLQQPSLTTLELPENIPVSLSEQKQSTITSITLEQLQHASPSMFEVPQDTPASVLEHKKSTITSTILEQLQYTSPSMFEAPQDTLASISEQKQYKDHSTMDLPQDATVGKVELPLHTTVSILELPQQFSSSGNLYNQSNNENGYYYKHSGDSYSLQTIPNISVTMRVQSDVSRPDEYNFTKKYSHINSSSLVSEIVNKESTNQDNNTIVKDLFILNTLINPFRKENFHKSKLNVTEYKQNKNENYRNNTNTQDITDLYKNKNIYSPPINRASTPEPFRYTELLQNPYSHFAQHETLTDSSRESTQAVLARAQNTQTLKFKVSDILNLNNLNSVNNQHPLSERASSYRPTIIKSISFNFDTEEGRREFDLAVSSGLLSEV